MRRVFPCFILLALLSISGCLPKVATLDERPQCSSSVEGFFQTQTQWTGETPALLVEEGAGYKVLEGTVQEVREEGILFDREQVSPAFDPDPKLYENNEIVAYVNVQGETVRGRLPLDEVSALRMTLFVRPTNETESNEKRMIFKPNRRFGFCMPPGWYEVRNIHFENIENKKVDSAVQYGSAHLRVAPDSANYLGTLQLNVKPLGEPGVYPIPVEPEERPQSEMAASLLFGGLGGLAYDIALEMQGVTRIHTLSTKRNPDFTSKASLPLKKSRLHLDPNENIIGKIDSVRATR